MFLNIQIGWIILKTCDQQFTLTTKKSLHITFKPRLHDRTCCQTGLTTGWVYRVYSRLSKRLYNPVWQPVERTVAVHSTRLSNRFDNRLYRVNGVLDSLPDLFHVSNHGQLIDNYKHSVSRSRLWNNVKPLSDAGNIPVPAHIVLGRDLMNSFLLVDCCLEALTRLNTEL